MSTLRNDNDATATLAAADPGAKKQIAENYGRLPLSFEINKGQIDREVKFFSRGAGFGLYLTSSEAVMVLNKPEKSNAGQPDKQNEATPAAKQSASSKVITMKFSGANPRPRVFGLEELPGKSNYFIGNSPTNWRSNVSNYAKVKYEKIYPGVDMVYYGNQRQLEFDFIVSPKSDASVIKLSFEGMDGLRIDQAGDLVLSAKGGDLRQHKPIVYQEINGIRRDIAAGYVLLSEREVGFKLGVYDRSKPLVIDPVISYGTYLGGQSGYDYGYGIAVDSSGNAYVVGETGSPLFPTRNSLQPFGGVAGTRGDAFITKLNATGTQFLFSTYFGGSSVDAAEDVALDAAGNVYLTGWTASNNFPVTTGAFQTNGGSNGNIETFVTKLNATGSAVLYSTYLAARDGDYGYGIAIDASGNAYVIGQTDSNNFPTTAGAFQPSFNGGTCGQSPNTWTCFDVFVTKVNPAGSGLVYSTYLGGTSDEVANASGGIAVDSIGAVYVTGDTRSTNFPTVNPVQSTHAPGPSPGNPANGLNSDVFVTKLDPSGATLTYSTYLGGSGDDEGNQVVVDTDGYAYVTGIGSGATGFPITPGAYLNSGASFVLKMNQAGNGLVYSTNLPITSNSIAIDSAGNAYVSGQQNFSGFRPANVSKLNASGTALIFSFFFGGTESQFGGIDGEQMANDIALDSSGGIYVTGNTFSANFPVTAGAPQQTFGGNICSINFCNDGFVAKIADISGYKISGRVTDSVGNSLGGVRLTLTGGMKTWVVTDSGGNYAFNDLMPNRNYTVTPTKEFFTFAPVSLSFTNLSADQTADFVGTLPNVSLSGSVTDANNSGISGVTVTLSGSQSQTTQTNTSGSFSFTGLPTGGTYTVTPSRGSDVFDPLSKTFTQMANNQTVSFKLVYQITGQVTDGSGVPDGAVTVSLSGSKTATTQTDANGNYTLANVPANGNYTVTPSKAGILTYTFNPPSASLTNLTANQVANFSYTTSTKVALFPDADAYVEDGTNAANNFGAVTPLLLKSANQTSQRRDVYLKYDLSTVSRKITNAKLRIWAALSAVDSVNTSAWGVTDTTWGENTINWNNKPLRDGTAIAGATVAVTSTSFAMYELDVTSYILIQQNAGQKVISLALHNPSNSTPYILLNSREAATNKPQLLLTTVNNNNGAPSVNLTSPGNGTSFTVPGSVPLSASASDSDGSISKVDYYAGTNFIGSATTSPYNVTWPNVGVGSYTLTAVATDNQGLTSVSSPVQITVNNGNVPPAVELTSPLSGAIFAAGSNLTLSATALDVDGSVTQVEFFDGATSLGTDNTAPYSVSWNNVPAGSHSLTARATDNAGGVTPSVPVNIAVVWQTGFSAVVDANVKDGSTASTNFGTQPELQVQQGASGSNRESYLRFDLTAITGTNTIAQARLRVFGRLSDTSGTNAGVGVYSSSNTTWAESGSGGITWNTKPTVNNPALATTTVTDTVGRWYEFDVTGYVQGQKNGGQNVMSLALKSQAASSPFIIFNSREASGDRPQLVVWTTQGRNALFAVGSSNLNAGDTAAKTRLESLGYTVTVKVANNNLTTADANGKALVVVSSTCTATSVGTKFQHVAVPVVNWEFDVLDDFGMVVGTQFGTSPSAQTQLSITSAGHPLAASLTGTVTVVTSGSNFSWGGPNVNGVKVATLVGDPAKAVIFGYDDGATMPGLDAPARRVAMFMTDLTAGSFNSNGTALFDAAVKWATEVITAPAITQLTPVNGPVGTVVTLSGMNFGATQGASTVSFNSLAANVTSWSDKKIVVAVPLYATTGVVVVKVNGVSSNGVTFTVAEVDSDADGLADWWELQYFGNLTQAASGDPDGDGLSNLQEYQQGRNPTVHALIDDAAINLKLFTPLVPSMP